MTDQTTPGGLTRIRHWWADVLLDWALQVSPKSTKEGRRIRELVAAHDSLK